MARSKQFVSLFFVCLKLLVSSLTKCLFIQTPQVRRTKCHFIKYSLSVLLDFQSSGLNENWTGQLKQFSHKMSGLCLGYEGLTLELEKCVKTEFMTVERKLTKYAVLHEGVRIMLQKYFVCDIICSQKNTYQITLRTTMTLCFTLPNMQ